MKFLASKNGGEKPKVGEHLPVIVFEMDALIPTSRDLKKKEFHKKTL